MIVKVCGIMRPADARAVAAAGADAVGFVLAPSPRRIDLATACAIDRSITGPCRRVGVFVDPTFDDVQRAVTEADLDIVQLHGTETPADCRRIMALGISVWKRVAVGTDDTPATLAARGSEFARSGIEALLIDPGKGDGRTFRWALTAELPGPLILAGGLRPENVADAIDTTRTTGTGRIHGVDVSSGVETEPGIKDPRRIDAFVAAVRATQSATQQPQRKDGSDAA